MTWHDFYWIADTSWDVYILYKRKSNIIVYRSKDRDYLVKVAEDLFNEMQESIDVLLVGHK